MTELTTVSQDTSRWIDSRAAEHYLLPTLILMELAGRTLAEATAALPPLEGPPTARPLLVCAGRGKNAGDGFVAARHLANAGHPVHVSLLGQPSGFSEGSDPQRNLAVLQRMEVPITASESPEPLIQLIHDLEPAAIVDALLGTGLRGEVRPPFRQLIAAINASSAPVAAADLPSGLDGDTGQVRGDCVCADVTVTFGFAKVGLVRGEGPQRAGRVIVADISIPWALKQEVLRDRLETP